MSPIIFKGEDSAFSISTECNWKVKKKISLRKRNCSSKAKWWGELKQRRWEGKRWGSRARATVRRRLLKDSPCKSRGSYSREQGSRGCLRDVLLWKMCAIALSPVFYHKTFHTGVWGWGVLFLVRSEPEQEHLCGDYMMTMTRRHRGVNLD